MPHEAPRPLHLAVALDGTGWHPAAWRAPDARPAALFTASYWVDLVQEAEAGLLDLVTFEDGLSLQSSRLSRPPADRPAAHAETLPDNQVESRPKGRVEASRSGLSALSDTDERTDQVRGRLDAVLVACRVAPLTNRIGLVPTAIVTHTEPFHLSKAIATLDYVSDGRGGIRVQVSAKPHEAAHFGRRVIPTLAGRDDPRRQQLTDELFDEAADYVEVLRRLWDSWEDDAEIRDVASGRFVDRDRLHYIDFAGRWFSVRGPSITPRPPQGQPIVAALAHASVPYRLVARSADIGFVTPRDPGHAAAIVAEIRAEQADAGRAEETVRVFGDLVVFLDDDATTAECRKAHLDELDGAAYRSDAEIFVGTAAQLADRLLELRAGGLSGFRLRPGALPHDLTQITRALVPELQRRRAFRTAYQARTLRERLGLARPANRYATARGHSA